MKIQILKEQPKFRRLNFKKQQLYIQQMSAISTLQNKILLESFTDKIVTVNPVISQPDIKLSQLNDKDLHLFTELEERLNEYKSAFIYFKANDLQEKKKEASRMGKVINLAITAIKSGQGNNISMDDLPPRITPEYICGRTQAEKAKVYDSVLEQLNNIIKKKNSVINFLYKVFKTLSGFQKEIIFYFNAEK